MGLNERVCVERERGNGICTDDVFLCLVHYDRLLWESIKQYEGTDPIEPWLRYALAITHTLCQRSRGSACVSANVVFAPKDREPST